MHNEDNCQDTCIVLLGRLPKCLLIVGRKGSQSDLKIMWRS